MEKKTENDMGTGRILWCIGIGIRFSIIRDTSLVVHIIRTIACWGAYWVLPVFENCHLHVSGVWRYLVQGLGT